MTRAFWVGVWAGLSFLSIPAECFGTNGDATYSVPTFCSRLIEDQNLPIDEAVRENFRHRPNASSFSVKLGIRSADPAEVATIPNELAASGIMLLTLNRFTPAHFTVTAHVNGAAQAEKLAKFVVGNPLIDSVRETTVFGVTEGPTWLDPEIHELPFLKPDQEFHAECISRPGLRLDDLQARLLGNHFRVGKITQESPEDYGDSYLRMEVWATGPEQGRILWEELVRAPLAEVRHLLPLEQRFSRVKATGKIDATLLGTLKDSKKWHRVQIRLTATDEKSFAVAQQITSMTGSSPEALHGLTAGNVEMLFEIQAPEHVERLLRIFEGQNVVAARLVRAETDGAIRDAQRRRFGIVLRSSEELNTALRDFDGHAPIAVDLATEFSPGASIAAKEANLIAELYQLGFMEAKTQREDFRQSGPAPVYATSSRTVRIAVKSLAERDAILRWIGRSEILRFADLGQL